MATPKRQREAVVSAAAQQVADQLGRALRDLTALPVSGARNLIVVRGITSSGDFAEPIENVIQQFITHLAPTESPPRLYTYGGDVVFERFAAGADASLVPVCAGTRVEGTAPGILANLAICEWPSKSGVTQFSLPPKAVAVILNAEPLRQALPRIETYARRPLFSPDFVLLSPGYHRAHAILIHGPDVEPDLSPLPLGERAIDRLPPRLRALLGGFCFRTDTDLTNLVGLMVTGVLANHFLDGAKGLPLVDGDQPGVGKTLLLRVLGLVLDGADPRLIHYTLDDEEVQKRICATLRGARQSVLIIDNAKVASGQAISSSAIETNSMAPEISLRVLGTSDNFVRPNDVIWGITMNQTKVSPDLLSRGLPIRLAYAGPAGNRTFAGPEPIRYAREHRAEILGELAGFVVRWTLAGRPRGTCTHRCLEWATLIGGVLAANGFDGFLTNFEEASAEFNPELDDLTQLALAAVAHPNGPFIITTPMEPQP